MALFRTPLLEVVDLPADEKHHGGTRWPPLCIVLHHSGGSDSRKWLSTTSPPDNPVSCHRLIRKDGANYKIVPDNENAWCQGFGVMGPFAPASYTLHLERGDLSTKPSTNFNVFGLSIEMENMGDGKDPYPFAQIDMTAAQIVEWWGQYGFLPILYHWQIDTRKNDPKGFPRETLDACIWTRLKRIAFGDMR